MKNRWNGVMVRKISLEASFYSHSYFRRFPVASFLFFAPRAIAIKRKKTGDDYPFPFLFNAAMNTKCLAISIPSVNQNAPVSKRDWIKGSGLQNCVLLNVAWRSPRHARELILDRSCDPWSNYAIDHKFGIEVLVFWYGWRFWSDIVGNFEMQYEDNR